MFNIRALIFLALPALSLAGSPILVPRASTAANAPVATVTTISANVGPSLINQQIVPIQDSQLAALLNSQLPQNFQATCKSCTTQGSIEVSAGGWDPSDSEMSILEDFSNKGFLKMVVKGFSAEIEPDSRLLPGFNLIDKRIPISKLKIGSISLSKATALDKYFVAYLPVKLTLNSQVDIFPSLKVEVPDGATLYMDLSDTASSITGFDQTKVTPKFDIDAPNVSFFLTNGFTMAFQAEVSSSSFPDIGGNITAALGLLMLNTTVTEMHQVNSDCQHASGSGTYADAVHVQYAENAALNFNGSIHAGTFTIKVPRNVPKLEISKPLGDQCYNWDASSNSVKQVSAASAVGPSLSKLGLVGLLAFMMAAGTF